MLVLSKNLSVFSVCLNLGTFKLFSKAARDVPKHASEFYTKQCALANNVDLNRIERVSLVLDFSESLKC